MYDTTNTDLIIAASGDAPVLLQDISGDVSVGTVAHGGRVDPFILGCGIDVLEPLGVIVPANIAAHIASGNGGDIVLHTCACRLEALPEHVPVGHLPATHVMVAFHGPDGVIVERDDTVEGFVDRDA